jgi:putative nucleotidyltransferase with HDIG domain
MKKGGSEVSKNASAAKGEKPKTPPTDRQARGALLTWNRETQLSLLFWITVILVTYLLLPAKPFRAADYEPGEIAQKDIKATQSFLVEDPSSTKARKLEAEASVLALHDFERDQVLETLQNVMELFQRMRNLIAKQRADEKILLDEINSTPKSEREVLSQELELQRREAASDRLVVIGNIIERMALDLEPGRMQPLIQEGFSERMEIILADSLKTILGVGIVENRETLLRERGKGVSLRMLGTISEEIILDDFSSIMSLETARSEVRKGIASLKWTKQEIAQRSLLEAFAQDLVGPNMTYNRSETEERRKKAIQQTSPVYYQVQKGEVIVRAGDPLTEEQLLKINELKRLSPDAGRTSLVLGLFLLVTILLFMFYLILVTGYPQISTDIKGLIIIAIIIVLQIAVMRGILILFQALTTTYTGLSEFILRLAVPFALGAMVAGTLFPVTVALVMTALTSILSAAFLDWSHVVFLYSFIGGLAASFSVIHCRQRSSLIRAGLAVSGANLAVAFVLQLYQGELFSPSTAPQLLSATGGGILVALIASLAIPALESSFNVASDMKLMELANLNQPALKEMIYKAPGTYHHSVLVGSLAEAAAEEIGANPLLARVAAAYHDIGKISKPEYFVENQENRDNRHEKLSPSMSALILASHVKDGTEIAREHRLPRRVVDIIKQHHGTRLITFFYNKAKEMEDPSMQMVDERDFRYPGPRPRNREAALIMLADGVEAASKVLSDPTPARIRGLVQKIINDIFVDGQLEESNLTLRDLHLIARSFTRTITGILHHRIDYPQSLGGVEDRRKEKKKKDDRSPDQEPGSSAASEGAEGISVQNIKRLGQS